MTHSRPRVGPPTRQFEQRELLEEIARLQLENLVLKVQLLKVARRHFTVFTPYRFGNTQP